jgi:ATP-dependent Clp protease adaptor protein ClpS
MDIIDTHRIVMHNDDEHDFPYVMACLIRLCSHDPIQAEQCALITHNTSKCVIKNGSWNDMDNLSQELLYLGLKVTVEEHESHLY